MNNLYSPFSVKGEASSCICKALVLIMFGCSTLAQAAPVGGVVSAGSASVQSSASTTTVTQGSQKAVVNWQGFNVAPNETVNFVQPGASAVILNRVQSPNGSVIQGSITANGKVFLINPNGILFSQGASVNVGGFVASTLGLSDGNFMSGNYKFSGDSAGAVVNLGQISTTGEGGYVALLGPKVTNDGVINARLGTVAMAAGSAITLDISGDQLLNVTVDQGVLDALVRNGNLIQADGGQVIMTALGAGSLLSSAVNNTGVIQAQSIQNQNGLIRLTGDATSGAVNLSGTLDVSGPSSGQTGGRVQVTASAVNLTGANIKATGDAGGGQVLLGGNIQGAGPLSNAKTTTLDRTTQVDVSAVRSGDGGKIAVWSNGTTSVDATLIARGGSQSGNGGFVETSGHILVMGPNLNVNTLAPRGVTGLWLIDPANYEICLATCTGAADTTTETPALLIARLVLANVTITATNNITVSDAVSFPTAARTLTLNATNNIFLNAAMDTAGAGSGFSLIAGHNITTSAGSTITTSGGGSISLNGTNNVSIGAAMTTSGGGSITLNANNDMTVGGVMTVTGTGSLITVTAGNDAFINSAMTASNLNSKISVTATRDITATGTLTASQTGTEVNLTAHRDISAGTITATGGSGIMNLLADRNVSVGTTSSTGITTLKADVTGKGPGAAAGTVTIGTAVTASSTVLRFNPDGYANTTTEITAYGTKITGGKDIKAWTFATGVNKAYDGTTAATLAFSGDPTLAGAVTLDPGTAAFNSAAVANSVPVTYSGYSISGVAAPKFALFSAAGTTSANITGDSGGGGSTPVAVVVTTPATVAVVTKPVDVVVISQPVAVVILPTDVVVVPPSTGTWVASPTVATTYSDALLNSETSWLGGNGLITYPVSGATSEVVSVPAGLSGTSGSIGYGADAGPTTTSSSVSYGTGSGSTTTSTTAGYGTSPGSTTTSTTAGYGTSSGPTTTSTTAGYGTASGPTSTSTTGGYGTASGPTSTSASVGAGTASGSTSTSNSVGTGTTSGSTNAAGSAGSTAQSSQANTVAADTPSQIKVLGVSQGAAAILEVKQAPVAGRQPAGTASSAASGAPFAPARERRESRN